MIAAAMIHPGRDIVNDSVCKKDNWRRVKQTPLIADKCWWCARGMHKPATVSSSVMEEHRQGLWVKKFTGFKNQNMFEKEEATQAVLWPDGDTVGAGIPEGGGGGAVRHVGMHFFVVVSLPFPSPPLAGLWSSPTLRAGRFAWCGQDAVMYKMGKTNCCHDPVRPNTAR